MKLTLVLLFLGLSFVSGEYKFPDLNENKINEGEKIISEKFDEFKSKAHNKYLLKPFFEDLLDILTIIQKKNNDFIKRMPEIVSHVKDNFNLESVEEAQKEFHGSASVQYYSLIVVAKWAEQRLERIKDFKTIHDLLFDVQVNCLTAAANIINIAEKTFKEFEDIKKLFQFPGYVIGTPVKTSLENIEKITEWTNFDRKTQEAIDATNKLIQKSTPTLTQKIKECLTCGSTKDVE